MSHVLTYLHEVEEIAANLDHEAIDRMVDELVRVRSRKGRLWIAGFGGSAANASHAANDLRKLCGIEAYSLTESVAEVTARGNDEGWANSLSMDFAHVDIDALLILSVGGGTETVSQALFRVISQAEILTIPILAIVGKNDGYAAKQSTICLVIPTVNEKHVTPHTEAFQMVILHCLVSHPLLQKRPTKW